uniref:WD_REPEATS_REGION domain-containing protein n=1 Tax=Heterorhabditis bacteriophora TaxID=37862 RepID=A0A1I7X6G0_HETBA
MDEEVQIIGTKTFICQDTGNASRSLSARQITESTMDEVEIVESSWIISDDEDINEECNDAGPSKVLNRVTGNTSEMSIIPSTGSDDVQIVESNWTIDNNDDDVEIIKDKFEGPHLSGTFDEMSWDSKTIYNYLCLTLILVCYRFERHGIRSIILDFKEIVVNEDSICKKTKLHVELDFDRASTIPSFVWVFIGFMLVGLIFVKYALMILSSMQLGDVPYDAVWHPCGELLATSSKHHPIHLWNTQGVREASYRGINHLDELSAAYTMAFSADGLRMYGGYEKYIRIWDVRRPGRQITDIKTWNKGSGGQKAIISSIAVHPVFDGVYAVGCYGPSIALYSDRTNSIDCLFTGEFTATTCIKYSRDGLRLYSAGRKVLLFRIFPLLNRDLCHFGL